MYPLTGLLPRLAVVAPPHALVSWITMVIRRSETVEKRWHRRPSVLRAWSAAVTASTGQLWALPLFGGVAAAAAAAAEVAAAEVAVAALAVAAQVQRGTCLWEQMTA